MSQHPNARLTPRGRETLVSRVAGGERVSDVSRQMGVERVMTDNGPGYRGREFNGALAGRDLARLRRALQLGASAQRLREPPAHVAHRRRKQRHGT